MSQLKWFAGVQILNRLLIACLLTVVVLPSERVIAETGQLSDAAYLNQIAKEVTAGLPEMVGSFELAKAWSRCPAGCQEEGNSPYLLLDFNTVGEQQNMPIEQVKQALKPKLMPQYCTSEAVGRNMKWGVFFSNRGTGADYNNFWIYPTDCSESKKITDAEFMNNWANDIKAKAKANMLGSFEFVKAVSSCPAGCSETYAHHYLRLIFSTMGEQQNMPIEQVKQLLTPFLLQDYCNNGAIERKLMFEVYLDNRVKGIQYNYWIESDQCP